VEATAGQLQTDHIALFLGERAIYYRLVQITRAPASYDVRLRRLPCGKASPFRRTTALVNLLRAGWKAEPSSLRGGGRKA
jgi:hypothetical protein